MLSPETLRYPVKARGTPIKSPVSWVGNKTPILPILYALFPLSYERYIEPFGGSGSVLLGKPWRDGFEAFNDRNRNLINLFRCMRDRPLAFIRELGFLSLNSRDDFKALKHFFRKEEFDDAFLNEELQLTEILLPEPEAGELRTRKLLGYCKLYDHVLLVADDGNDVLDMAALTIPAP